MTGTVYGEQVKMREVMQPEMILDALMYTLIDHDLEELNATKNRAFVFSNLIVVAKRPIV